MSNIGDIQQASYFSDEYQMISDSQDIEYLVDYLSLDKDEYDVTAAFILATDGEYDEVWVSESGNYFLDSSRYERVR